MAGKNLPDDGARTLAEMIGCQQDNDSAYPVVTMARHLLPLLLLTLLPAAVPAASGLTVESMTLQTEADPIDRYGRWQLRSITARDIEPQLADALQRRLETPIGETVGDEGDYRVLSHREAPSAGDGALYRSLDWIIDEQIHSTIWYHLHDGRPDKEAMEKLKSEFYSDVPAHQVKNPARHLYDGDNDWPFDLIDYLASSIETPVIQLRLANHGNDSMRLSELRFTHLLSWGGDADAEAIPTNLRPGMESAVLDWRKPSQLFRLDKPLTIAPGEEATLAFTIKAGDAAEGESGGMLLTMLELGGLQGADQGTLFVATLLLRDSLDDLAY